MWNIFSLCWRQKLKVRQHNCNSSPNCWDGFCQVLAPQPHNLGGSWGNEAAWMPWGRRLVARGICAIPPPAFTTNSGKQADHVGVKICPVVSDHRVTFVRWESSGYFPTWVLGSFCVWSSAHLHRAIKLYLSSLLWTFQASLIRFALYVAIKAKHLQSFQFCRIISESNSPKEVLFCSWITWFVQRF